MTDKIDFYYTLHGKDDYECQSLQPDATVGDLKRADGQPDIDKLHLFDRDGRKHPDETPLREIDPDTEEKRLHFSFCDEIAITVRYQDKEVEVKVPPSLYYERVIEKACDALAIDYGEHKNHVLEREEDEKRLEIDYCVGCYADGDCKLVVNLLPKTPKQQGEAMSSAHEKFEDALSDPDFRFGVNLQKWKHLSTDWPYAFFNICTRTRGNFVLKLDLEEYPEQPPLGCLIDPNTKEPLSKDKCPGEAGAEDIASRTFQGDCGVYAPYDRDGLRRHSDWATSHPTIAWNSNRKISFYMRQIYDALNS